MQKILNESWEGSFFFILLIVDGSGGQSIKKIMVIVE